MFIQVTLLIQPMVQWYGGLSGVLRGLAAQGELRLLKPSMSDAKDHFSRWIGVALCVGVLIKVWLEQPWLSPTTYDPRQGFGMVYITHAFGAVSGLLVWVLGGWTFRKQSAVQMSGGTPEGPKQKGGSTRI